MTTILDNDGQPHFGFNAKLRRDRSVHEMLGLVKGVIVDGEVTAGEAQYLAHWINANPDAIASWPGSAMAKRLRRIFADGRIDDEEREDLLYFLQQLAGEDHGQNGDANPATRLPLDTPAPPLFFSRPRVRLYWSIRLGNSCCVRVRGCFTRRRPRQVDYSSHRRLGSRRLG